VSSHTPETVAAAAQVSPDVQENVRQLMGCAIAWPRIAAAVGLEIEVCRCLCNLPPSPKPDAPAVLPWESASRQKSLFD
jgi:hypothetical protein